MLITLRGRLPGQADDQPLTTPLGGNLKTQLWLGALALAAAPCAMPADIAGGVRLGTLGYGVEGTFGVKEWLNVRVPLSVLSYSDTLDEDDVEYDGELDFSTIGVLLDYHPFKGTFHLSAGLMSNGNEVNMKASDSTGNEEYELGDATYTSDPDDPLTLTGGLSFDSLSPYVGLGWGNPILGRSNWYFKFELGALFQGSASVGLTASGSAVNTQNQSSFDVNGSSPEAQAFRENLEAERMTLEDDLSDFDIYPVVSFSLGYRFSVGGTAQ